MNKSHNDTRFFKKKTNNGKTYKYSEWLKEQHTDQLLKYAENKINYVLKTARYIDDKNLPSLIDALAKTLAILVELELRIRDEVRNGYEV